MSFEQTLMRAYSDYMSKKSIDVFEKYFYILDCSKDTLTLPGPGLWQRRFKNHFENPNAGYISQIWHEAKQGDGLIHLFFARDKQMGPFIRLAFDTYLTIPADSHEYVSAAESGSIWSGSGKQDRQLFNRSEHGRIRYDMSKGDAKFSRMPDSDIGELMLWIPGEDEVAAIYPYIEKRSARDGSVDAFFRHMQYEKEIEKLIR